MKNIECLQRAVEYIEDNLCNKLNISEIADYSYISERTLTELFASISGMSVMEYVRKRRLTLAAFDVLNSNDKIIEIAVKYCYESQESFSRAFHRFHGSSPQQLRISQGKAIEVCKIQFVNNNVVGEDSCSGYRVLENGPIYYTNDMDKIVEWFREVLGWVANIDLWNESGQGAYGCAMPIPENIVSNKLTPFMGFSLFYGEPFKRVIGYITVDNVEAIHGYIVQNGWEQITNIESKPWGARECSVTTPDGGMIRFTSFNEI